MKTKQKHARLGHFTLFFGLAQFPYDTIEMC